MKTVKKIIVLGVVLACLMALSCSSGETEKVARPINFALQGNPDTLDPHKTSGTLTFQVLKSFYDTLYEPDDKGNLVPSLAESYSISEDGLHWTFKIRPNVRFHNGDVLTSEDVRATFARAIDPETGNANDFRAIDSVSAPDPQTCVITLKQPNTPFLATIASGWSAILPASLLKSGHDFGSQPVGTGPYSLQEWIRDGRIVMKKNPNYWKAGEPKSETVIFNIIPEQSVGIQGVQSGQVDIVINILADEVPPLEADPNIVVESQLSATILVMSMNCESVGLDDLRLRQAVNYAIDKQLVLDTVYGGGVPTATFLDPANAFYKDFTHLYPYNPDKARELIAQVGQPAKREFLMVVPQNFTMHVQAAEVYQDMLRKVGLNVKIQMVDWSTWMTDVFRGGKFDFTVIGHTGKLDPDGTIGAYGDPARYVRWNNPECLDLVTRAKTVSDPVERRGLYDRALELLAVEVPFMYLGSAYTYNAYRADVHGFRMVPKLDTLDFRNTEIR